MLVRSATEYASVVQNSITPTDANKLKFIQEKFVALSFNRFILCFDCSHEYALALEQFKLYSLQKRRQNLEAPFIMQVYSGSKFCPSSLVTAVLRASTRYIRDFSMFNACSSSKKCSSTRYASAANAV